MCLFDGEPYAIVYDPGKRVRNRRKDLAPFESILNIFDNEKEWTNALDIARHKSWSILLIFPQQTEIQITTFITQHILNRCQLHSIYVILRDEAQCNAQLTNMLQSQLYWCRSLTAELFRDIREMCASVCQKYLSFYEQKRRKAEADIRLGNAQSARSIANLYAQKHRDHARLLAKYYEKLSEQSD